MSRRQLGHRAPRHRRALVVDRHFHFCELAQNEVLCFTIKATASMGLKRSIDHFQTPDRGNDRAGAQCIFNQPCRVFDSFIRQERGQRT